MADNTEIYSQFVADFNTKKEELKMENGFVSNMCYGWRIGTTLMENLRGQLDEYEGDVLSSDVVNNFKSSFNVGSDLLGIRILGTLNDYPDKIFLIQASEKKETKQYNNISFKIQDKLFDSIRVKCPVTNLMFNWPYAIKGENTIFKDSHSSYKDSNDKIESIKDNVGKFNDIDDVISFSGYINYRTTEFIVNRILNNNVDTALNLEAKYNEFLEYTTIPWIASSSSSSSDSSSSSASTPTEPKPDNIYYNTDNYNVSYVKFVAPVKKVWEWQYSE